MMAGVPGLVAKLRLRGQSDDGHGVVCLWQDRDAHENSLAGDLWAEVVRDQSSLDPTSLGLKEVDALTEMTQPGLQPL